MPDLLSLFEKREVSIELLWKFLVKLVTTPNSEENTRDSLAKYLDKQLATITHIFNVLEPYLDRERTSLSGYAKDYFVLNWGDVLYSLVDLSEYEEAEKETFVTYIFKMLENIETLNIVPEIPDDLFSRRTRVGKLLTLVVEMYPPLLFIFLLIFFLMNSLAKAEESSIENINILPSYISRISIDILFALIPRILQDIVDKLLGKIQIKGLGNIAFPREDDLATEEETIEPEETITFRPSDLIQGLALLVSDGYVVNQDRLLLSLGLMEEVDQTKVIELKIPLKDGTIVIKKARAHEIMKYMGE